MYYDKIKFKAPPADTEISTPVPVLIAIAISNRALVFHSKVWSLNKLVPIFVKGILSKPVFKCFKHHRYLFELNPCFVKVFLKYIIIALERPCFTLIYFSEMCIVGNIYIYTIVIYGTAHKPVISSGFILMFYNTSKLSIRYIYKLFRHINANQHTVGFIIHMVFAWPP